MELLFLDSNVEKALKALFDSSSKENFRVAKTVIETYDTKQFYKELEYITNLHTNKVSESYDALVINNDVEKAREILKLLCEDLNKKVMRYYKGGMILASLKYALDCSTASEEIYSSAKVIMPQ